MPSRRELYARRCVQDLINVVEQVPSRAAVRPDLELDDSSVGMLFGMMILRDMLVAYLAGLWLIIPWMWWTKSDPAYLVYAIAVNIIFMLAMLPEIREILRIRREYGKEDMSMAMSQFPMGRSMLRIMQKLGLKRS